MSLEALGHVCAPQEDQAVRQFYDERGGARMFDSAFLSREVGQYLAMEAGFLDQLFRQNPGKRHLIEIGCGYGKYRQWAADRLLAYDGLDLVGWLIQQGRLRALDNPRGLRSGLHVRSCEGIVDLFIQEGLLDSAPRMIALFPFNCFGNLARPKVALDAVAFTGSSIVVSTYGTDPRTTELRLAYYRKCHYSKLIHETLTYGNVIRSAEGLCAHAYAQDHLERMFESVNYRLLASRQLGDIGVGYYFGPAGAAWTEGAQAAQRQSRDGGQKGLGI